MLLLEHSKLQTMRIVHWIGRDADRLALLMQIFLGNVYCLTQRSALVVRYVGEQQPELMAYYYRSLVDALQHKLVHHAVKRSVLNVFEVIDIPDDCLEDLTDYCFHYLADPQEGIAIRCISMTILEKVCRHIPELKNELQLLIEEHLEFGTAAFKSRAKRVLRAIQ